MTNSLHSLSRKYLRAYSISFAIRAAVKIGLPEIINFHEKGTDEIANNLKIKPTNIERILNFLQELNIVKLGTVPDNA